MCWGSLWWAYWTNQTIGSDKPATSDPAVGFAMGLERLLLLMQRYIRLRKPALWCICGRPSWCLHRCHQICPWATHTTFKSSRENGKCHGFKSANEKADKSGARLSVIIAQDEVANQITIKNGNRWPNYGREWHTLAKIQILSNLSDWAKFDS